MSRTHELYRHCDQRIADAGVDPAALTTDIQNQASVLAAAVAANTPVTGS